MTNLYKIFAALVLVVGIGVVSQGSVLADSANVYDHTTNYGDGCTNGGTMMNAALFIAYVDADSGKLIRYSNNMSVRVTSDYSNLTDHNGYSTKGIVKNYSESDMAWDDDKIFTTGSQAGNFENCEVPKAIETYLGEPDSNPNLSRHALVFEGGESTATTNADWQLNCGVTAIGIAEGKASGDQYPASRTFTFTGDSVNDIPAGYTAVGWGTQTGTLSPRSDMNYINYTIVLTYRVREVRSANVTPWAEAGKTINVGESFTYRNGVDVSDKVGTGGTFNWAITGPAAASGSGALNNGRQVDSSSGSIYYGQRSPAGGYTRQVCASAGSTWATYNACASQTLTVNGWNLEASTTRSAASINVGTVGSFTHSIKNVGLAPTHVFIDVDMAGVGGADNTSMDIGWPAGTPSLASGVTKTSVARSFTPDVRGTGATYCDGITATPKADNDSASATSSACIDVIGWDIVADSKVTGATSADGRSKVILKGSTATFTHRLYSTGAPLHKPVDGDVLISSGTERPECAAGACNAYRATETDLTVADSDQTADNTYKFDEVGTFCEYQRYNPSADNDATPNMGYLPGGNYADYTNGAAACVYVIDPIPAATDGVEYEKNATGVNPPIVFTVSTAGYCPPAGSGTIPVTLRWTLNLTPVATGDVPGNWGNGNCSALTATVSNLNATQVTQLNNSDPGTKYTYTTEVVGYGLPDSGSVTVLEVPFTRFYGNDVYATNGDIRFNDSSNNDATYEDKGAVVQYAGLSFGNVYIDTSAFRLLATPAYTQPPSSLDAPGSVISSPVLGAIDSNSVYDEVVADLPECSTTGFAEAATLPNENGCWTINDDAQLGIPRIGALDGFGGPNPSTYNHRVTLINQDATKPLMIVGNIENRTTDYTDVANTGVLLIVSAGDIYIDNNVERIDAILVSAKNIYTCGWTWSKTTYGVYANDQLDNNCRGSLTINGAISANEIKFQRAVGTRNLSLGYGLDLASRNAKCLPWAGVQNCTSRGYATDGTTNLQINNSGGAAEIVNFPAYLYYASPYLEDNSDSGAENDALFQVPPRL